MRLTLDTNRYTDFARGDKALADLLERAERIHVPFIVMGELRAGFAVGRRGAENERRLKEFIAKLGVDVLFADEATTHHYANLFRQLREAALPIPTNDLWIAALVVQHDLVLCSRGEHFRNLPQIPLI
ncbi:MAG: type II toxin-antitoxin system VapC family toxin [Gemmatimonadota bacterium]